MANRLQGGDIRGGFIDAAEEMRATQSEIKQIAKEADFKILDGQDRKDFLVNMTQEEFDVIQSLATQLGEPGQRKLARLLDERTEALNGPR